MQNICKTGRNSKQEYTEFYQHFLQSEWFWFIFLILKHRLKEIFTPKWRETSGQSRIEVLISVLTLYSRVSGSGVSRVTGWGEG